MKLVSQHFSQLRRYSLARSQKLASHGAQSIILSLLIFAVVVEGTSSRLIISI
ncbi:hypothetical protein PG5_00480 [Pseudomonas sp. G5(2012)]|nr:hypothetical protein PG5_00480 [Pseudomonas sp. G5(2012)]